MSLPTYARFYDKDGVELGTQFVNVGWFMNAEALSGKLLELATIYSADHIKVYSYTIPTSLIRAVGDPKNGTWAERRGRFVEQLKEIMENTRRTA